jgi:hypothetical protein
VDLLGPGLAIHPDYIPASIVLGRCHMDLGDVQAAETAFLHVLALDGENVIALKALADISERLLKFDEAERWLRMLLSVDRSNDDAREQLQRVEVSRRQAEVASSAEPSSTVEPPGTAKPSTMAAPLADIAPATPPFEPPVAEPALGWVSQSSQAGTAPPIPMEELEPTPLELLEEPEVVEPIEGLVGREVDTPDASLGDFRVETAEDIVLESAGGSEFQMPDASLELYHGGTRQERAPFEENAPVTPASEWKTPPAERTELKPVSPEPASPEPAPLEPAWPEPVARSYAPELYKPEPLVYEPPAPMPPVTAPAPAAPEPIAASTPRDYRDLDRAEEQPEAQAPVAPPKRSYSAGETGGRSVASLFQGILSARPPLQASAAPVRQETPGGGAPTRPAADALSLSSVFGEEAPETPPAVPAPSQGAGSVSFDDFFTSPSASPAARTPRTPDPKNDDLDQFHAWLQNLKR